MKVKLCDLVGWDNFPEGVSAANWRLAGALIRELGPNYVVELDEFTHYELDRVLRKLKQEVKWYE